MEIKRMKSIIHLDEMKPVDFISFLNEYIIGTNVSISEKVDGQNISFGSFDGKFFTKSKNSNPVYDSDFYSNNEHMFGFKQVHDLCHNYITHEDDFQLFFELFANSTPNSINYDLITTFPTLVLLSDVSIDIRTSLNILPVTVIDKQQIEYKIIEFNRLDEYIKLYNNHKSNFRKRNNNIKKIKSRLINIQNDIKLQFLTTLSPKISYLSTIVSPEGLIIETDNYSVKLVDKNKFTEINKENHATSSKLKQLRKKFNREIITEIFYDADILLDKKKRLQIIAEYALINPNKSFLNIIFSDITKEHGTLEFYNSVAYLVAQIQYKYLKLLQQINNEWCNLDKTNISNIIQLSTTNYITTLTDIFTNQINNYNELLIKININDA